MACNTIKIFKKTDSILTFTWPEGTDLDGDTIYFTAKRRKGGAPDDSDAVIALSVVISTTTNVAQIPISDEESDVKAYDYDADIKRVGSGGGVTGYSSFKLLVEDTVGQRQ